MLLSTEVFLTGFDRCRFTNSRNQKAPGANRGFLDNTEQVVFFGRSLFSLSKREPIMAFAVASCKLQKTR